MGQPGATAAVNGAHLYYEVSGQGPPLLLLHAGVADRRMWDGQVAAFGQGYRVVRFDFRGFGQSEMPPGPFSNHEDVRGLMDFLQIDRAHLLGISYGGMVAIDTALAYQERVLSLLLGAPSVSGAPPSERLRRFWQEEEAALDARDLVKATELNLELWVDGPHRGAEEVSPTVREQVREMQLAIFHKEVPDQVEEIELEPPAIERLGELTMPVQVLVGALDLPEKLALAERLMAQVPNCQKVVIPQVAHMLNMEQPEAFNRSVLKFLAAVASGGQRT